MNNATVAKPANTPLYGAVLEQIAANSPSLAGLDQSSLLRFTFAKIPEPETIVPHISNGTGYLGLTPDPDSTAQPYTLSNLANLGLVPERVIDGDKVSFRYHPSYRPSDLLEEIEPTLWFRIVGNLLL